MRLRIFVEPQQGATYEDQLQVARCAEDEGFDAFFRSDHYLRMGNGDGLPGPTDAWTTLAGLARETTSIRLGTLVTSGTFRWPGPLAITVAQVDAMSGGRVELGLGAGWYEDEHRAYAIPFPPLRERLARLEEELAIITGLWETPSGETFDHDGHFFQVTKSPGLPKPTQRPRPPVIVGGTGPKRTPALAAHFADEFNTPFLAPAEAAEQYARVDEACDQIGSRSALPPPLGGADRLLRRGRRRRDPPGQGHRLVGRGSETLRGLRLAGRRGRSDQGMGSGRCHHRLPPDHGHERSRSCAPHRPPGHAPAGLRRHHHGPSAWRSTSAMCRHRPAVLPSALINGPERRPRHCGDQKPQ